MTALPLQPSGAGFSLYMPIVVGLTASLGTLGVLTDLWRRSRAAWLGWLVLAWAAWSFEYTVALLASPETWHAAPVSFALLRLRDALIVGSIHALGWQRAARALMFALGVAVAAHVLTSAPLLEAVTDVSDILLSLLWLIGGLAMVRRPELYGVERWMAAVGFWLNAGLLASGAWGQAPALLTNLSLGVTTVVHLTVALGIATGVRGALLDAEAAAQRRVARALEFVARGAVPMCAHCRSVRDGAGEWRSIDSFVHASTDVAVADVLCPECAASDGG